MSFINNFSGVGNLALLLLNMHWVVFRAKANV